VGTLERERSLLEAKYRKYLDNLEQARIDRALEKEKISNVSVVQPATRSSLPKPRRRAVKLVFAAILAAAGSIVVAMASEHLDHTLGRPEDIGRFLSLPTLVSIPVLKRSAMAARNGLAQATTVAGTVAATENHRVWEVPGEAAEFFEVLRLRLLRQLGAASGKPVVVGVTSCREGEGVSFVAANLAVALSRYAGDVPVLYMEAAPGQGKHERSFGMKALGAAEIRTDEEGRTRVHEQSLYTTFTPNRPAETNAATTAAVQRYDKLLPMLREKDYAYVVIDMPPLSEGSSSLRLAGPMDGLILVIESEKIRWEVAQWARGMLVDANTNLVGAVLNKRKYYVPKWLYARM
jgi:polysaccharide biosynthesis transport protein